MVFAWDPNDFKKHQGGQNTGDILEDYLDDISGSIIIKALENRVRNEVQTHLLKQVVNELKILNIHLTEMTDMKIECDDIEE